MLKRLLLYTACFLALYAAVGVSAYLIFNDNLPDIDDWSFRPKRVTNVYSADGRHLQDFLEENREILTYEEVPESVRAALLAAEDRRFFSHWGIDIYRIPGALLANLRDRRLVGQGPARLPSSSPAVYSPKLALSAAVLLLPMRRPRTRARSANRSPPS